MPFTFETNALIWRNGPETVRIEPWGADSLRVRATQGAAIRSDLPGALGTTPPASSDAEIAIGPERASIRCGLIRADLTAEGQIRFTNAETGAALLAEPAPRFIHPPARWFKPLGSDLSRISVEFQAVEGERFYGLGQHQHGLLDQKGCVIDLWHRNTEVSIPFLVSSRGYGFLWHNPAVGRVELGRNCTRWVAEASAPDRLLGHRRRSYAEIMAHYADATGHAPVLPEWAAGFWQCKLRYASQEELLAVAREYHRRGLPLDVIVADFFHWTRMGEWHFDPEAWPDPAAMVAELDALGVKLMVSIWPTVNPARRDLRRDGAPRAAGAGRARHPPPHGLRRCASRTALCICATTTPPIPRPGASSGSGCARAIIATASRSGGWTPASRRSTRSTMTTCAITWATGWRWPASTHCCTSRRSTTG